MSDITERKQQAATSNAEGIIADVLMLGRPELQVVLHIDLVWTELGDFVEHFNASLLDGRMFDDSIPALVVFDDLRPWKEIEAEMDEERENWGERYLEPLRRVEEVASTTREETEKLVEKLRAAQEKALAELDEAERERASADPEWEFEIDEELAQEVDRYWLKLGEGEDRVGVWDKVLETMGALIEQATGDLLRMPFTTTRAFIGAGEVEKRRGTWRVMRHPLGHTGHLWQGRWERRSIDAQSQGWLLTATRFRRDRLRITLWESAENGMGIRLCQWLRRNWGKYGVRELPLGDAPPMPAPPLIKTEDALNRAILAIEPEPGTPGWWAEVARLFFAHKRTQAKYSRAKLAELLGMDTKHVTKMVKKHHTETHQATP